MIAAASVCRDDRGRRRTMRVRYVSYQLMTAHDACDVNAIDDDITDAAAAAAADVVTAA